MRSPSEPGSERPDLPEFAPCWPACDVPLHREVLADGRAVVVAGHLNLVKERAVQASAESSPALNWTAQIAHWLECAVGPNEWIELVQQSGLCKLGDGPSDLPLESVTELLASENVPMRIEFGDSAEDLAAVVEQGSAVLAAANAGLLMEQPGSVGDGSNNALVAVVAVVRHVESAALEGFYVMPSPAENARFISVAAIDVGWLRTGGVMAVSETAMPTPSLPAAHE